MSQTNKIRTRPQAAPTVAGPANQRKTATSTARVNTSAAKAQAGKGKPVPAQKAGQAVNGSAWQKTGRVVRPRWPWVPRGARNSGLMAAQMGQVVAELEGTKDALAEMKHPEPVLRPPKPQKEEVLSIEDMHHEDTIPRGIRCITEPVNWTVSDTLLLLGCCLVIWPEWCVTCAVFALMVRQQWAWSWLRRRVERALTVSFGPVSSDQIDRIVSDNKHTPVWEMDPWFGFCFAMLRFLSYMQGEHLVAALSPFGYWKQDMNAPDVRAPHVRGTKMSRERATIITYDLHTTEDGSITILFDASCLHDIGSRSELLDDSDLRSVHNQAVRYHMTNIPGRWFRDVVSGTSKYCRVDVSLQRESSVVVDGVLRKGARRDSEVAKWALLLLMPVLIMLLRFAAAQIPLPLGELAWIAVDAVVAALGGVFEEMVIDRLGIPPLVGHLIVAVVEAQSGGNPSHLAPALAMHLQLPFAPLLFRLIFHPIFNLGAVAMGRAPAFSWAGLVVLVMIFGKRKFPKFYAFGYRIDEVDCGPLRESTAEVEYHANWDPQPHRPPCQVSIGPVFHDYAPPMPDPTHCVSVLAGAKHRFACDLPPPDMALVHEFNAYCKKRAVELIDPILPGRLMNQDEWLPLTHYSLSRIEELREAWDRAMGHVLKKHKKIKGFAKKETYMVFKPPRGINSRHDVFKCAVGPAFSMIEAEVFKDQCFIKHVPVRRRPEYIMEMLGHFPGPWWETDYTSFEGSFGPRLLMACEMQLYKRALLHYPELYKLIKTTMCGENICQYKWFTLKVKGRRMSGEMCTSLGNGFTNRMLTEFTAHKSGVSVVGLYEGDDGLFYANGPMDVSVVARLGFKLKFEKHDDLYRTSFCGLQLSRDLCCLKNPFKVLLNFGWSHSPLMMGGDKVRLGLCRAKAMSLLYEHPRCPILSVLALRYLDLTAFITPRFDGGWYHKRVEEEAVEHSGWAFEEAAKGIPTRTRIDFAELYGISVEDQMRIEDDIRSWGFGVVSSPTLMLYMAPFKDCATYAQRYVSEDKWFL